MDKKELTKDEFVKEGKGCTTFLSVCRFSSES